MTSSVPLEHRCWRRLCPMTRPGCAHSWTTISTCTVQQTHILSPNTGTSTGSSPCMVGSVRLGDMRETMLHFVPSWACIVLIKDAVQVQLSVLVPVSQHVIQPNGLWACVRLLQYHAAQLRSRPLDARLLDWHSFRDPAKQRQHHRPVHCDTQRLLWVRQPSNQRGSNRGFCGSLDLRKLLLCRE